MSEGRAIYYVAGRPVPAPTMTTERTADGFRTTFTWYWPRLFTAGPKPPPA